MSLDDIGNGRLMCVIALASVKPAEFVIFRAGQRFQATSASACHRRASLGLPAFEFRAQPPEERHPSNLPALRSTDRARSVDRALEQARATWR
jgi:hypothetical protein